MLAKTTRAARLPGPPELLPGRPDAVIDLQTGAGAMLAGSRWRSADARVESIDFVEVGGPDDPDPLGPGTVPNRTYDVLPHAQAADFDDSDWVVLAPEDTTRRLSTGRVCFNWYRTRVRIPERVGDLDPTGATVVFEVVVDDYAEVWVDGELPLGLGQIDGRVIGGFNAPNRVVLTRDARPGDSFVIAVFGINGPISASPRNYIWMRSATLDFYEAKRARAAWPAELEVEGALEATLERVAGGFEFTEGPVWTADGALLFSSPNTNVIYRWEPGGTVSVFRAKSGYAGTDIGFYQQPGSNGLAFDPEGRLTICQHGNRRVIRVEPHGNVTVLANGLNSPNDLVYRSDGVLYFTDPPFGLPEGAEALLPSGVYRVAGGTVTLESTELEGPNGIALAPDERHLYVGNWPTHPDGRKVVMRHAVAPDGSLSDGAVFFDMTDAPGEDGIDGIKVDPDGNLYVCGPGGIWVLSSQGEHLGTLRLPESPHNLAWGDADSNTLYITALTSIYRMRVSIQGA
jgi:gluconolactonase